MSPEITRRRAWARAMIARCENPPPRYGSREWHALPDSSPERVAAVVIAAESWALDGDDPLERLRLELEAERRAFKSTEDAEYARRRDAHRAAWDGQKGRFRPDPRIAQEIEREWATWVGEDQ